MSTWPWSYDSWIYNYLCNQCVSPLTLWARISLKRGLLDTTLCDSVCLWLATGRWFSTGTPVSSTNKTDSHNINGVWPRVVFLLLFGVFKFSCKNSTSVIRNFTVYTQCLVNSKLTNSKLQGIHLPIVHFKVITPDCNTSTLHLCNNCFRHNEMYIHVMDYYVINLVC